MKTCILPISYLPDLSFFHLMNKCHNAILLDDVKNPKANIAHIKDKELVIPISKWDYLNEIKIEKSSSWKEDHLKALKMIYSKEPNFDKIYAIIEGRFTQASEDVYKRHQAELLIDICIDFIYWFRGYLGIKSDIAYSSKMGFSGFPLEERCALMCSAAGTTEYISYDKVSVIMFPKMALTKTPKPKGISIIDRIFAKGKECLE